MTIPPRFMSDLRDRLTLSDVIGGRIKLTRAGQEFKGCCPFHKEKTASFYVNDLKQFYHCFGCGAHGDAIGFVMQHDNLSFIEAIETLAARAGMQVPQQSPQDVAKAQKAKDLHSLMEDATKFFEATLYEREGQEALQYLRERDLEDATIQAFRIGYAPADGQVLRRYLRDKGYTDAQMIEAGVTRESQRGTEPYGFFRERIIFPVADRRGRVVAFGGRILPDHLRPPDRSGHKPPKYINSSDTPLFHKGRMLYNESRARQAAADGQPVIVVEGYVDVIACARAGYAGAVAPLGTAVTEEQILAFWKMIPEGTKTPILCFDGDNAGRRAAFRASERLLPLLQPDQSALFAFLPEGEDPDSLIRAQGRKAFEAVLDKAVPLIDFLWSHYTVGKNFKTPEERAGLSRTLEAESDRIADRSVQQYYRQAFKERLYQAFGRNWRGGKQFGAYRNQAGQRLAPPVRIGRPAYSDDSLRRQILLATIINHPGIYQSVEEEFGTLRLHNARLDSLRQATIAKIGESMALEKEELQNHLREEGFEEELRLLLNNRLYVHAGFAKPQTDLDKALSGWQETWRFIGQKSIGRELQDAGRALVGNFTEDDEERWRALHDVHKASGE